MTTTLNPRSQTVAGRVRAFMAEQQHNQSALAGTLGISQPNASLRYRGKRPYSIDELDQIAKWLQVRIEDFFRDSSPFGDERRESVRTDWRSRRRFNRPRRPIYLDSPIAA